MSNPLNRKVVYMRMQSGVFVQDLGPLDNVLPHQSKTLDNLVMTALEQGVVVDCSKQGRAHSFIIPWGNIICAKLQPETQETVKSAGGVDLLKSTADEAKKAEEAKAAEEAKKAAEEKKARKAALNAQNKGTVKLPPITKQAPGAVPAPPQKKTPAKVAKVVPTQEQFDADRAAYLAKQQAEAATKAAEVKAPDAPKTDTAA